MAIRTTTGKPAPAPVSGVADSGVWRTIGEKLDAGRGFGPGFNMLRLILASGVVLWHCFPLTVGSPEQIDGTPLWFLVSSMVPMFFALSGFLVIASADRLPVQSFLMNRIARIFPALVVVIFATAFIIGPAVSTLPLRDYFSQPQTWRYLLGAVGLIRFELPGVFTDNPTAGTVNGALWTVPHELLCYLIVAGLIVLGLARSWWAIATLLLAFFSGALLVEITMPGTFPPLVERVLRSVHFAQGAKIIPFFMFGALAHIFRHRLPLGKGLALLCLAIILAVGFLLDPGIRKHALFWLLAGPPLTYLTVWAGMVHIPEPRLLHGRDISYGVYVWHFPILQLIVWQTGIVRWWLLGVLGIVPIVVVALASWVLAEGPIHTWRRQANARRKALAQTA